MLKTETAASSVSIRNPISDDDEDGKGKKTKTFAIPTALARWFDEQVFEDPSGVVKKEWLYNQYVKFCRERGNIRPKHKQIFSKLVFTVFPRAGSCRLGSIGSQVPYYFGIKRRKESNKMGEQQLPQQRIFSSTETSFANSIHQPYPVQQTRSMLGVKDERSNLNRMSMSMLVEPKIEDAPNNKRKRDSIELTNEQQQQFISYKKAKPEEETTEKEVAPTPEENPTLSGDCLKQRLLYLHRLLAPKEADPYQPDVESYVTMFVEQFWPELSPLQWDLSGSESLTLSEIEKNSFALCLCCSLFCGSLVKKDFGFAKETLMLCSQLVNSLAAVMNEGSASERMSKNFGISLLFLARGLVDCSLFSNDMDAVILAKTYCAMAAEIFP